MNRPTDSVRIALFDADNSSQFLVLAEADDPDNWKLSGGKFDTVDETPWQAAERELREELGLNADTVALTEVGRLTNNDGVSARHIFVGTAHRGDLTPSEEIAATQWVTEQTIPDSPNKAHMLSAIQLARTALL